LILGQRTAHWFRSEDVPLNAPSPSASPAEAVARLDALTTELSARGLTARVHTPRGRIPSLRARNPEGSSGVVGAHLRSAPGLQDVDLLVAMGRAHRRNASSGRCHHRSHPSPSRRP
jgi:hypothetical protein